MKRLLEIHKFGVTYAEWLSTGVVFIAVSKSAVKALASASRVQPSCWAKGPTDNQLCCWAKKARMDSAGASPPYEQVRSSVARAAVDSVRSFACCADYTQGSGPRPSHGNP